MVVELSLMVVAVGLSLLAGYLLQRKQKNLTKDDKPTTIATRGAYIPYVLGLRRVGPVFTWAGDRFTRREKVEGGKGGLFGGPKQQVYYERGWHVLCLGPAKKLKAIISHGKPIFVGPITRESHPSGSRIDLGKEGAFEIYWGESTQPTNTDLGVGSRVGITSRWSFCCYVFWDSKRLGPQPAWPLLDYVLEVDLPDSPTFLTQTAPYFPPTYTLGAVSEGIDDRVNGPEFNGGNETTAGQFIFIGDVTHKFQATNKIRLTGNALPDQDLFVIAVRTFIFELSPPMPPNPGVYQTRTRVLIDGGLAGASAAGTLTKYDEADDDGYNPAHIIAQMLFGQWPLGFGLDTAEWDMASLEALGQLCVTENLRGSVIGLDGENLDAILGTILQDLGVMLPINPLTGLLEFVPVRKPTGVLSEISEDLIAEPAPEIEMNHAERQVDRLVMIFQDRANNFRDMSIAVDEDGQASFLEYQRARSVPISSTVNFATAAVIAERRSQEELAGGAALRIFATRACRCLKPGQAVLLEGYDDLLRLTDVETDPLTGKVTLLAIPDFYGVALSDFVNKKGNTGGPLKPVEQDLAVHVVEVPAYLNSSGTVHVIVLRLRAHEQVTGTDVHFSPDNVSYTYIAALVNESTGGTLTAQFNATDSNYLAQGPTIQVDPDVAVDLNDLNSMTPLSETDWRQGRLVAAIGTELLFVKDLVLVAANQWRLDGVLRARFDTQGQTHANGAPVFLFRQDQVTNIDDVLLQPNALVYVKSAPRASGGQVALPSVTPVQQLITGKGVVPLRPWGLRVTAPNTSVRIYRTGNNISFAWGYRSTATPKTGAGMQNAGTAVIPSAIQGFFRLNFDNGTLDFDVEVIGVTTYTLTNANLVAQFGSEPATLTVTLVNVNGAFVSPSISIVVTKIV